MLSMEPQNRCRPLQFRCLGCYSCCSPGNGVASIIHSLPLCSGAWVAEACYDTGCLCCNAQVAGIGSIDGVSYMMIGHQKGRNTKVTASC